MTNQFPSEQAWITDLRATSPELVARPLGALGLRALDHSVWAGNHGAVMPDSLPIFDSPQHGFEAGCDGATYLIIPIALTQVGV